jgi:hypothetical protein
VFTKERYDYLKKKLEEPNWTKTKLFGVALTNASRYDLMDAIKAAGATVKHEGLGTWGDTYYTEGVLKCSRKLEVYYTVTNLFASAKYTFPSGKNNEKLIEIRDFVSNKYGEQNSTKGLLSGETPVQYLWELQDGIRLMVYRDWPDTTVFLSYTYPEKL